MSQVTVKKVSRRAIWITACLCLFAFSTSVSQAATPSEQIAAHLEAGEFQPAVELAASVENADLKSELLSQIAMAQTADQQFEASRATLNRMPLNADRANATAAQARQQSLQGGGADFESLISLIETVVSPLTWEAVGGLGTINDFDTGGGIYVDANGMVAKMTTTEQNNRLKELALEARQASLNNDMAAPSNLRMVSLTRLEKAVQDRIAQGLPVADSMQNLAGIYQVQHIFVYPESGEIVIAGPAAGWKYTESGYTVSSQSGVPTLQLDDLVTLLRTFGPEGERIFGCSIDPRPEGLKDLKDYVAKSQAGGAISSRAVRSWTNQLQRKLGEQDVTIYGVPVSSRVARVIVEADFRMKLIGIGKLEGGSNIPDYFELMTAAQAADMSSLDALRWWLSLKCESILKSNDSDAYELRESSVLCQSENQFINKDGERVATGTAEANNQQFANNFTNHYSDLSRDDLVFADLQNVFDLALISALINQQQLAQQVNWDLGSFAAHGDYHPATYEAPQTVDSVVNHKVFNGKNIVVQVAGGVQVDVSAALSKLTATDRLENAAEQAQAGNLPVGRWWWDAKKAQ
ncbi:DUF1598 domain-containing protein [uncultured Rubinisphaera sp.]|uniref:DUF1598 domain-containing protein n=1 Tax=uncultured Rubinisphaera sp. TaxID=1678686 RepID=UPI000EC1B5B0|nr:hypothetical protein [Planctomycetaceae bacterium]|tara:strand:+ start:422 stop:2158 length:1737 start_codon:yes stop_codon:yes gene_type:complete